MSPTPFKNISTNASTGPRGLAELELLYKERCPMPRAHLHQLLATTFKIPVSLFVRNLR